MSVSVKDTLKHILDNQKELARISDATFQAADIEQTGSLGFGEVEHFVKELCSKMRWKTIPKSDLLGMYREIGSSEDAQIDQDEFQGLIKAIVTKAIKDL